MTPTAADATPSRICIAGAGAIGCTLAARLALAGHDVSVVARRASTFPCRSPARTSHLPASAVGTKVPPVHFYSAQLHGRVGYHDFEGITLFAEERTRMLASLGYKHILVLRNHGIVVCERDIPRTFFLLWTVRRAAEIQCQAGMIPGEDTLLDPAVSRKCADLTEMLIRESGFATKNSSRRAPTPRTRASPTS